MRLFLLIILFALFIPQPVPAGNSSAPEDAKTVVVSGDFKTLKHTMSLRADTVIDAQTILMNDGKVVRLLGLEYPLSIGPEPAPSLIEAKERLTKLLPKGTEVMLYQTRNQKAGRINRMGHTLAHLVLKDGGGWINGMLVAEGLAWAVTDQANPEMSGNLYALEQKAREAKLGLWADNGAYGLLTAENAAQGDGQFRVVEGTVNRAATSKNNLYLNFGTDWRQDFTVMISSDIRRRLSKKQIDPMGLAGRKVRVRGWVRSWNGPFMELETPERLELVDMTPPPPSQVEPDAEKENTGEVGILSSGVRE